jgi:hypothetical protein
MYLNVVAATVVELEDTDNFRSFKVVVAMPGADLETVRRALSGVVVMPDQDTAWVSEQALRTWPGRADNAAWQDSLTAMIQKAKPYGWVDEANKAIKAHVEWPA